MGAARLLVSLIHYPVYTLGPGVRVGLWTQGCSIRCRGCMSAHTWDFSEKYARPIEEVAHQLVGYACNRLTISGGEPFDQPEALLELLKRIRPHFEDILVYTGYRFSQLRRRHARLLSLIDALIDSPFQAGNETHLLHKGSANQRFFLVNAELWERYEPWASAMKDKRLQMVLRPEGVYVIGIPYQKDFQAFRDAPGQTL